MQSETHTHTFSLSLSLFLDLDSKLYLSKLIDSTGNGGALPKMCKRLLSGALAAQDKNPELESEQQQQQARKIPYIFWSNMASLYFIIHALG